MSAEAQFRCIRSRLARGCDLVPRQTHSVPTSIENATAPQATGVEREITQSRNHDPTAQPARYNASIMRPRSSQ